MFPFPSVPELSACLSLSNFQLTSTHLLLSKEDSLHTESLYANTEDCLITNSTPVPRSKVELTLWQYVNMSWYRAPLWDLQPDITTVGMLLSEIYFFYFCEASSLTRGRVCNLQCNHLMVRVAQNSQPYFTVSSETPPTWRAWFWYLYPPWTGWPSYTPGHLVPFTSSQSKSKLLYDWQSASQYVLVSSTLVGLATRYYFLSECCCLKFSKSSQL
jgi:hypothetical protein